MTGIQYGPLTATQDFTYLGDGNEKSTLKFSEMGVSRAGSALIEWDKISHMEVAFAAPKRRRSLFIIVDLAASVGLITGPSLSTKESRLFITPKSGQRVSWWFEAEGPNIKSGWSRGVIEQLFSALSTKGKLSMLGDPLHSRSLLAGLEGVSRIPRARRGRQIDSLTE